MLICLNGGLGNQTGNYIFAQYLKEFEEFGQDVKFICSKEANEARAIVLDKFNTEIDIAKKEDIEAFLNAKTKPKLVFDLLSKNIFDKIWVNNLWTFLKSIRGEYDIYPKKTLTLLSKTVTYKEALKHKYPHTAVCDCYIPIKEFYNEAFRCKMREHFILKEGLDEKNSEVLNQIKNEENSVGIHIRRGDFLNYKMPVVKKEFLLSKMKFIQEKYPDARFFIFSDGMDWARENLKSDMEFDLHFVDINDETKGYLDFVLLNNCRHRVYSASSFSKWTEYLNPYKDSIEFTPEGKDLTVE